MSGRKENLPVPPITRAEVEDIRYKLSVVAHSTLEEEYPLCRQPTPLELLG